MKRRVSILGATGSVGRSALDLIARRPDAFAVEALTAHSDAAGLARQAREVRAARAVIADPGSHAALREALAGSGIEAAAGPEALIEAACAPADLVIAAIVGIAGLAPTLAAARCGRRIALANKECLVCAGPLLLREIDDNNGCLIPIDSEHNALFQMLSPGGLDGVERIVLTASGGPFLRKSAGEMARATPQEAQKHPVWPMGPKISVDSATLMNKALELIEAHYLFSIDPARLGIVVHPQSVVHAMVVRRDGTLLAHLGPPDMRGPLAHALAFPAPAPAPPFAPLDPEKLGALTFEPLDEDRFPAPRLARDSLQYGRLAPTLLNAANEAAVEAFLRRRIGFLDIVPVSERVLEAASKDCAGPAADTLETIMQADALARIRAGQVIKALNGN